MKDRSEILKKLKALADRGIGGEATNANDLLKKLMLKYDISEEEILEDVASNHELTYWGLFGENLMNQVAYYVLGDKYNMYKYKGSRSKVRVVKCTEAQFIEIQECFNFYRSVLDQGFKDYYNAFIQVEELFGDSSPEDMDIKSNTISKEALRLALGMDKHERLMMIEDGLG